MFSRAVGSEFCVEIELLVAAIIEISFFAGGFDVGFMRASRLAPFAAAAPAASATTPATTARTAITLFVATRLGLALCSFKR
jgi:hypothetical protein